MQLSAVLGACLLITAAGPALAVGENKTAHVVRPTQAIPREPYRTWSLFLICTPDWATPERSQELANLYRRFRLFGDAIGKDNLAVWFWTDREVDLGSPTLSDKVDVARSAEYCRALNLAPSEGPFLVITSSYPALPAFPAERGVFTLGSLQPSQLAELLNRLTDQLALQGKIASDGAGASSTAPTGSVGFWIRLLEGAQHSMVGFGCRLKLEVKIGALNAELRECAP